MDHRIRVAGVAALGLLVAAALAADPLVANPSFENAGELPDGWRLAEGARSDGVGESLVVVDRVVARDGTASLRLSGDAKTRTWRMAEQEVAVREGDRVTLRVAARCQGVVRESRQFTNANGLLSFVNEAGERKSLAVTAQLGGDREWVDLVVDAIAPPGTANVRVGLVLSMSGTVWFDDVRVEIAPATAADEAGRARAFQALAGHLRRTYPFFELGERPAPDDMFDRHRANAVAAGDEAAFVTAIRRMLGELDDVHVSIETPSGRLATAEPSSTPPNLNVAAIRKALTETIVAESSLLAGRIGKGADAIGYVLIGSFQLDAAGLARIEKALDDLADAKALILDVRTNVGGDERLAGRIAGRFVDHDVVYARATFRDPTLPAADAFAPPIDRVLKPVTPGKADTRRVVVLQGPYCISSTEGFLAMMQALPTVTTMGQPSRGASGNPAPFDLLPTVKVWTSRWRSITPDGECIEGKGIAPKIVVEGSHKDLDPTLERALGELRR